MIEVSNCAFDRSETFDLFVVSGGYESRSSYLARLDVQASTRLAVKLPRVDSDHYDGNLEFLAKSGWDFVSPEAFGERLAEQLRSHSEAMPIRVAVDISSMPRHLLGSILEIFHCHGGGLQATFLYCFAWFETSARQALTDSDLSAQPVSSYFAGAVRPSHMPIALAVGLGLEAHRSDGVREFLEPDRMWAFVAHGLDERFVTNVLEVNDYFLRGAGIEALGYDIRDTAGTFRVLRSLCAGAGQTYRVVLAPSGPKVFGLACLLAGLERDVERPAVWRVGAVNDPLEAVDVEATGEVTACAVRFLGRDLSLQ